MELMRSPVLAAAVAALLLDACSLLVDSDVGVRDRDGGGEVDGDGGTGEDAGGDPDAGPCGSIGRLRRSFAWDRSGRGLRLGRRPHATLGGVNVTP